MSFHSVASTCRQVRGTIRLTWQFLANAVAGCESSQCVLWRMLFPAATPDASGDSADETSHAVRQGPASGVSAAHNVRAVGRVHGCLEDALAIARSDAALGATVVHVMAACCTGSAGAQGEGVCSEQRSRLTSRERLSELVTSARAFPPLLALLAATAPPGARGETDSPTDAAACAMLRHWLENLTEAVLKSGLTHTALATTAGSALSVSALLAAEASVPLPAHELQVTTEAVAWVHLMLAVTSDSSGDEGGTLALSLEDIAGLAAFTCACRHVLAPAVPGPTRLPPESSAASPLLLVSMQLAMAGAHAAIQLLADAFAGCGDRDNAAAQLSRTEPLVAALTLDALAVLDAATALALSPPVAAAASTPGNSDVHFIIRAGLPKAALPPGLRTAAMRLLAVLTGITASAPAALLGTATDAGLRRPADHDGAEAGTASAAGMANGRGLMVVLAQCKLERSEPMLREWALLCVRNLCSGSASDAARAQLAQLREVATAAAPELAALGVGRGSVATVPGGPGKG